MNGMVVILSVFRNRTVAVSACANVGLLRRLASLFLLSSVPQLVRLWCQVMFNLSAYADNHLALVKVCVGGWVLRGYGGGVSVWRYCCCQRSHFDAGDVCLCHRHSTTQTVNRRTPSPYLSRTCPHFTHPPFWQVGILEVIERKLDPEFEVRGVVPPWGYVCLTYRSFVFITLLLLNLSTNPTVCDNAVFGGRGEGSEGVRQCRPSFLCCRRGLA